MTLLYKKIVEIEQLWVFGKQYSFARRIAREGCNNVDFPKDTGQGDKAITVHILH